MPRRWLRDRRIAQNVLCSQDPSAAHAPKWAPDAVFRVVSLMQMDARMATYLTQKQEQALFAEYHRTGDRRIEERLMHPLFGLVGQLVRAYLPNGMDARDLFQEGAIGLLQAIRRFDPSRGVRLSTYASFWIRAFMFRYMISNYRLVRFGTTQAERRLFFRLNTVRGRLEAAGLEATAERVATMLGIDREGIDETAARLDLVDVSLDVPVPGREAPRVSTLPSPMLNAEEELAKKQQAAIVRAERERYRSTLDPRRRAFLDARFGDDDRVTLQEMGDRFGVSRERARQIEQKMLGELRVRMRRGLAA
jgi:RNA polymerase sigma-32 factor